MKVGLTFVILSIRGSICRACSVEEDIKPFPVVHCENGFHEMCQWVVTIGKKMLFQKTQAESTYVKSLDT